MRCGWVYLPADPMYNPDPDCSMPTAPRTGVWFCSAGHGAGLVISRRPRCVGWALEKRSARVAGVGQRCASLSPPFLWTWLTSGACGQSTRSLRIYWSADWCTWKSPWIVLLPAQLRPLVWCQLTPCAPWQCAPDTPANTKHLYNIYTMLDRRRRRWADIV